MHFQETDSMLDKYGGWPSRDGSRWKSKSFDWIEVKKKMQIDGFYLESIFELGFYYDFYDDRKTVLYVIKLFNYTSRRSVNTQYGVRIGRRHFSFTKCTKFKKLCNKIQFLKVPFLQTCNGVEFLLPLITKFNFRLTKACSH